MSVKKIGILTGGGDCPGLNPTIKGVVTRAADHGIECLGLQNGWKSLVGDAPDAKPLYGPRDQGMSATYSFQSEQGAAGTSAHCATLFLLVAVSGRVVRPVSAWSPVHPWSPPGHRHVRLTV